MKNRPDPPPAECPVCGAEVPPDARACPACGADERTGWDEESTRYDGLNLPDESFDYDEALRDAGLKKRPRSKGVSFFWWLAGIIILLVIACLTFVRAF